MNSNQATMQKLELMGFWGMMRALRQSMDSPATAEGFTADELLSRLVDAEYDERQALEGPVTPGPGTPGRTPPLVGVASKQEAVDG